MKTIKKSTMIGFEERKSKFIGYAKPISSKAEAEEFIAEIKNKHRDATHNCSAYKVIDNGKEYFKTDDDGEPSGTAGKPMGDVITYMEVSNLVVVATRYFGGIKLGAGGLIRNYAKTAKLAIQDSGIEEYVEKNEYILEFSYENIGAIEQILNIGGAEYLDKGYNEKVVYKVKITNDTYTDLSQIKDILIIKI